MVGEAWTVLAGKGAAFQNQNSPQPVFRVGTPGSQGIMEITDFVFMTIGPSEFFLSLFFFFESSWKIKYLIRCWCNPPGMER